MFAAAIATAAALLFVVQPMVARFLLPVVGGSTLVWSTALVFFQAALLAGYLVAHLLSRVRNHRFAFIGLLAVAAVSALPFTLPDTTPDWSSPGVWVLTQLTIMVAAPFVALAATSPLLQHWYARTDEPDADEPYRLYAASNAGSIVGLLAYPFLIEPLATLPTQALSWTVGFGALIVLVASCAAQVSSPRIANDGAAATEAPAAEVALWWVICAAIPSALLVTMTANITADIAPVPLLWVVPLAVYLASHVWVFSRRAPSPDRSVTVLVAVAVPYAALAFFDLAQPWWFFAPLAVVMLGVIAVAYHGELVRTRPAPEHLTTFYLWTAVGGVAGGAFATFGAPALFDTLFELRLELVVAMVLLPWHRRTTATRAVTLGSIVFAALVLGAASLGEATLNQLAIPAAFTAAVVLAHSWDRRTGLIAIGFLAITVALGSEAILTERSAYGRYRIDRVDNELGRFHELIVGRVSHGTQARAEKLRELPLSYYHPAGPLGQVMRDPVSTGPVAVIGLGVGAAAAYAREDRPVTFFELDPVVEEIARDSRYFTHLETCGDLCGVVIGDGRLYVAARPPAEFGVLVVDAFSGDAIPTHLITVEALETYKRALRPGGAILVNGSNMYVDIATVVANAGAAAGLRAVRQDYWPREAHLHALQVASSEWILLSDDDTVIERFLADPRWESVPSIDADAAWTDNWQNLFAHYIWR